ncbi:MAG: helix-turn-helix domain-containing protein [Desulfovibrio sp.]|jgi:excisionase family DNA binding protein|nr:helix-turn-helix domain-containing protein [Desulfovibrio sp.]
MGNKQTVYARNNGIECMTLPPLKTTYTLAEAADLLSCHRETLRNAIRDEKLKAARLGREFRISRLELKTFWIASGGGELFTEPVEDAERLAPSGKAVVPERDKEKKRPLQFVLPGTGKDKG